MKRYTVGIDLGTSNTVVAYAEAGTDTIHEFAIDQLVAPGQVAAQPLLPSVRYHPAAGELSAGDLQLPWPAQPDRGESNDAPAPVGGLLARALGAQVPGRFVTSAKSWLSHPAVDRLAPILPWGAPDEVAKVSPVVASASYLAHVRAAWNARFADAPLEQQDVVLTVPASFDEGARALTLEAAHLARLPTLRLLEEPQAALYDWLFEHRGELAEALARTRLVLICDVGGGTTDLTLIKVQVDPDGVPQLTRIGVGNHLMLGGDNMDLALARLVETRLAQGTPGAQPAAARLSAASLAQLVERCRVAKEQLLAPDAPASVAITVLGSGSRVIGGARSTQLSRDEVAQVVVEGFFPQVSAGERPRRSRAAIVEFGLPYASDPAVTRHVADFLSRLAAQSREALGIDISESDGTGERPLPVPDTLLLNGGVFRADALTSRLAATLGGWRGEPLQVLDNARPDVAVARGAVAYGRARAGTAPRIGGGSARSYFLVLDDDQGICLLPRGTEEGHAVHLDERVFALRLGQPVRFPLVSTVADTRFRAGELTALSGGDFVRLPPLATVVEKQQAGHSERTGADERHVRLTATMTEVGTLEMTCIAIDDPEQRWQMQFELRQFELRQFELPRDEASCAASDRASREDSTQGALAQAIEVIERAFGARASEVAPGEVKRLRAQLETTLGPRDRWDLAQLRALFDALWERAKRRRRSADHERLWLNLAGYCLRPGFGHPLDEWRVGQLWSIFDDGIQYIHEGRVWSEWWTLWRRAAGGLGEDAQLQLLDAMAFLQAASLRRQKLPFDPAKVGYADMIRVQASLERIPVERKIELADQLFERLRKPAENPQTWWAIGRIGARMPFYGSAHRVVPPDIALPWLDAVLALDWKKVEPAAFAAVQLARLTGDRSRDLPDAARDTVAKRLASLGAAPVWATMMHEVVAPEEADSGRMFGESLPAGLKLIGVS